MIKNKNAWIEEFREVGQTILNDLMHINLNYKEKATEINKRIRNYRIQIIDGVGVIAHNNAWDNQMLLNEILTITYASYVVMLECRNRVWEYDYMTFSRRIGELWEPFCKLAFQYSVKELELIDPPDFMQVQGVIKEGAENYIDSLDLNDREKAELKLQYNIPWTMVDSGGIKLALDLHFEQNGVHYHCDFKSGFSSNEKGNTNRLLLVSSIYHYLGEEEKTILFVRQPEDENNHYLQILKNSPYWDVYCANDCYEAMQIFTGFDMRKWLDDHVDWKNDIIEELRIHLENNELIKYLTW